MFSFFFLFTFVLLFDYHFLVVLRIYLSYTFDAQNVDFIYAFCTILLCWRKS